MMKPIMLLIFCISSHDSLAAVEAVTSVEEIFIIAEIPDKALVMLQDEDADEKKNIEEKKNIGEKKIIDEEDGEDYTLVRRPRLPGTRNKGPKPYTEASGSRDCSCNGDADSLGQGGECTDGKNGRWCYVNEHD